RAERLINSLSKTDLSRSTGGVFCRSVRACRSETGGRRPCARNLSGAIFLEPALEHEHGPQPVFASAHPPKVRLPGSTDRLRVEITLLRQPPLVEQRFRPVAQRPPEPFANRHAKTHLRALDQFARDMSLEDLPEDPLR